MAEPTDDDYRRWKEQIEKEDAEYAAAEKQLATAVGTYLWEMVRISRCPEWEQDPSFAMLAVARVTLRQICYQTLEQDEDADDLVCDTMGSLVGVRLGMPAAL